MEPGWKTWTYKWLNVKYEAKEDLMKYIWIYTDLKYIKGTYKS